MKYLTLYHLKTIIKKSWFNYVARLENFCDWTASGYTVNIIRPDILSGIPKILLRMASKSVTR